MGYTQEICNSTFDQTNPFLLSKIELHSSQGTRITTTISPIEKYFNPTDIKKAVDSLVLSRFAPQCNKIFMKKINRSASRMISTVDSNYSVSTYNISELLSHIHATTSNYCSIPESTSVNEGSSIYGSYTSVDCCSINATVMPLQQKLIILNKTKEQVLKVIRYDEIHNKTLSMERLEAEKLLLVTDIRMSLLVSPNEERKNNSNSFCSGTVEISEMQLWPTEDGYLNQYFICLIVYGSEVYFSEVSKVNSNGMAGFSRKFIGNSLPQNFKLQIKIYSVSPKVSKKLMKLVPICSCNDQEDRESLFTLCDVAELKLSDVASKKYLFLANLTLGVFSASVSAWSNLSFNLSGFLNVSSKHPFWNKQWCVLRGRFLKYFNNPQDEVNATPTNAIDLASCAKLIHVTREQCHRKHTFLLKAGERSLLMSADSRAEFERWTKYIKVALKDMKKWGAY